MTAVPSRAAERLALFGTLLSVFDAVHPLCDHWVQSSDDACLKGLHGDHYVYADGTPLPTDGQQEPSEPPTQPRWPADQTLARLWITFDVLSWCCP